MWRAHNLLNVTAEQLPTPSEADLRGVLAELRDEWIPADVDPQTIHMWACDRFGLHIDLVTPQKLDEAVEVRIKQLKLVFDHMAACALRDDGEAKDDLGRIAKVILEARNSLRSAAILYCHMDENVGSLDDKWNPDSFFNWIEEDEKATSFQKVLLYILKQLALAGYRRFADQCFKQVMVPSGPNKGEASHAWEYVEEIRDFIARTVQKEVAYNEWKNLTNPPDNADKVVKNLMAQDHMEFRELKMNRYLWSYRNGLYNVRDDMFWPFQMRLLADTAQISREVVERLPSVQPTDDSALTSANADFVVDGVEVWNVDAIRTWRSVQDTSDIDENALVDTGILAAALGQPAFVNVAEITSVTLATDRLCNKIDAPDDVSLYRVIMHDDNGIPVLRVSSANDVLGSQDVIGITRETDGQIEYYVNVAGLRISPLDDGDFLYTLDKPVVVPNVNVGDRIVLSDGAVVSPYEVPLTVQTCFRVNNVFYINMQGREAWPELGRRMTLFRRGVHVDELAEATDDAVAAIPVEAADLQLDARTAIAVDNGRVLVWHVRRSSDDPTLAHLAPDTVFYRVAAKTYHRNSNGHDVWPARDGERYTTTPPTKDDVSVKYFDTDFRFEITPETEATFDPAKIVMPEFNRIVEVQGLDADSQTWLIVMLARLFFPVKFDGWQVALFVKGRAGSGKSTMAQIVRFFYPEKAISTLTANIERQFGLEGIYQGLICICAEVREKFQLDQGDFQSAVSGEEVQIARKNQTPLPHKWVTPFFLLGNEVFDYSNNSGSIDRRIFMIQFDRKVQRSDPKLFEKFLKNIDFFHRKGVALYHQMLRKYGDRDIWEPGVVGKQIIAWKNAVRISTDGLFAFINDTNLMTKDSTFFIPEEDFKKLYKTWRMDNNWKPQTWSTDHWKAPFEDAGLTMTVTPETRQYHGSPITGRFIMGIDATSTTTMM